MNVQQLIAETEQILKDKHLECTVCPISLIKINDIEKNGISIKRPDGTVGVNIYLDEIPEGASILDIVDTRLDSLLETMHQPMMDYQEDFSFKNIQDRLRIRIVDQTCNRKYLATVVHQDIQGTGLSVIPEIRTEYGDGFFSAVITNEMAENNGYDLQQLISAAMTGSFRHDPPKLFPLSSVFDPDTDIYKDHEIDGSDIYVLTSSSGQLGAYTMVNKDILDHIAENIPEFFILPSSRHEVLIVPSTLGLEEDHLRQMVYDANRAVVSAEDFLSDDIFAYSVKHGLRRLREKILKEKTLQTDLAEVY